MKQGKIRDRGDDLAESAVQYAQSDLPTMQLGNHYSYSVWLIVYDSFMTHY